MTLPSMSVEAGGCWSRLVLAIVDLDSSIPRALWAADWIVTVSSVVAVAYVGQYWIRQGRPDWFATPPDETHSLREDSVLMAALAYLVAAGLLSSLIRTLAWDEEAPLSGLVVNSGAQIAGIVACLLIALRRLPGGAREFVFGRSEPLRIRRWVVAATATVVSLGFCPSLHEWTISAQQGFLPEYQPTAHSTILALRESRSSLPVEIALWIGAAVIAPIAEEFFFRGIVQNFLHGLTRRRGLAIGLAAISFSAVHLSQPDTMVALFFLGALLGVSYGLTGALSVPIVIHAIFNLRTLIWVAVGDRIQ